MLRTRAGGQLQISQVIPCLALDLLQAFTPLPRGVHFILIHFEKAVLPGIKAGKWKSFMLALHRWTFMFRIREMLLALPTSWSGSANGSCPYPWYKCHWWAGRGSTTRPRPYDLPVHFMFIRYIIASCHLAPKF